MPQARQAKEARQRVTAPSAVITVCGRIPLVSADCPAGAGTGRAPLFEGFSPPPLEGGLQRPSQEIPAPAEQERLAPVDHLAFGGLGAGGLQLLGQDEGLLDDAVVGSASGGRDREAA